MAGQLAWHTVSTKLMPLVTRRATEAWCQFSLPALNLPCPSLLPCYSEKARQNWNTITTTFHRWKSATLLRRGQASSCDLSFCASSVNLSTCKGLLVFKHGHRRARHSQVPSLASGLGLQLVLMIMGCFPPGLEAGSPRAANSLGWRGCSPFSHCVVPSAPHGDGAGSVVAAGSGLCCFSQRCSVLWPPALQSLVTGGISRKSPSRSAGLGAHSVTETAELGQAHGS